MLGTVSQQPSPDVTDAPASATALFADPRLTVMGLFAEAFTAIAARGLGQLAEHGTTPAEFEVLLRLARSPGGRLRMTDLSAQTSLTTSGTTRVVDRLVDRGLVTREACLTDRRATYAVVTEGGRDLAAAVLPGHLDLIEAWLTGPLAETGDLEVFTDLLRRLRDRVAPCATAGSRDQLPGRETPGESRT